MNSSKKQALFHHHFRFRLGSGACLLFGSITLVSGLVFMLFYNSCSIVISWFRLGLRSLSFYSFRISIIISQLGSVLELVFLLFWRSILSSVLVLAGVPVLVPKQLWGWMRFSILFQGTVLFDHEFSGSGYFGILFHHHFLIPFGLWRVLSWFRFLLVPARLPGLVFLLFFFLFQEKDCVPSWFSASSGSGLGFLGLSPFLFSFLFRSGAPNEFFNCAWTSWIETRIAAEVSTWESKKRKATVLRSQDLRCEDGRCEDIRYEAVRCEDLRCEDV